MELYLDFDGVIVDSISETYKMMDELKIDLTDRNQVSKFYKELDWNRLLNNVNVINNAFEEIEELESSGKFSRVCILTTVNSLQEMSAKVKYIRERNKSISVICVPAGVDKHQMVDSRNAILVDDYKKNLEKWRLYDGNSILFSNSNHQDYYTINSLKSLLELNIDGPRLILEKSI